MAGFRNLRAFADAVDSGQSWVSSFRKVPAVTTIAGQWFDFSGAAGNPVPNYFASEPLVAATLEAEKGIYHGPNVSPARKYVHRLTTVHGAASATTTTGQNVEMILADYLIYYPFIDMDAAGEEQSFDNTVTLPRWADGAGVKMFLLAQATTLGGGRFTVSYTNSDGVAGRVSPNVFCAAAQPTGAVVNADVGAGGLVPFIPLQDGDKGVRSVQSITFSVANGGLGALVLTKPIMRHYQREESRVSTGTVESFGSPAEFEAMRTATIVPPEIKDGAFLAMLGRTAAGSVSGGQYVGTLETVWG